jgi:hypothetical protein
MTLYENEHRLFPETDGRSILRRTMRYLMDVAGGGSAWCTKRDIRDAIGLIGERL